MYESKKKKCIYLNIHIRLEKLCYRLVAWQKHIRNSPQPLILNQPRYNLIRKSKTVKTLTLSLLQKVNSPNLLCFNINPPLSQHIFLKLTKHWYRYQNLFKHCYMCLYDQLLTSGFLHFKKLFLNGKPWVNVFLNKKILMFIREGYAYNPKSHHFLRDSFAFYRESFMFYGKGMLFFAKLKHLTAKEWC